MEKLLLHRILSYLTSAVETVEKDTDEILGVYIEIGKDIYSWNGESFVKAGLADNLLRR